MVNHLQFEHPSQITATIADEAVVLLVTRALF